MEAFGLVEEVTFMVVPVQCPSCGFQLKVAEKHLGRQASCPRCQHRFVLAPPAGAVRSADFRKPEGESLRQTGDSLSSSERPPLSSGTSTSPIPTPPSEQERTYGLLEGFPPSSPRAELRTTGFPLELPSPTGRALPSLGEQPLLEGVRPGSVSRPLIVVLIVFYWFLGFGIPLLVIGLCLSGLGFLSGFVSLSEVLASGATETFRAASLLARLGEELIVLVGFLILGYALVLIATCYGLWTFQAWARNSGRWIAIGNLVVVGLQFCFCLIVGVPALLVNLGHAAISALIAVYIFGGSAALDRLRTSAVKA